MREDMRIRINDVQAFYCEPHNPMKRTFAQHLLSMPKERAPSLQARPKLKLREFL
jgi:hypothetical protein